MQYCTRILSLLLVMLLQQTFLSAQTNNAQPQLRKINGVTQLFTDGKPFLILGGELGNSSVSDYDYMRPIWNKCADMHLNTVLAPVYWELVEPEPGKFDFKLVDSMLLSARSQHLKLALLWFGTWKNSMSCYAPAWIKTNQQKFERARDSKGKALEILSAFSKENLQADINAFTQLMKHIAAIDAIQHTVLMVQVENEIGFLTEAREYTAAANTAFHSPVPAELVQHMTTHKQELVPEFLQQWRAHGFKEKGSWEDIFGKSLATDEIFQAWYYARFTNAVAEAGKKVYNLPMFVNTALNYKNVKPGEYPSAGPLPHLMDVWQAAAPAIDFLSPDFYNPYFKTYCDLYTRRNNPLFIPEIRSEANNAAKVFYAVGHYRAMGFSPFSIESAPSAQDEPIGKSYAILQQLAPVILQYQGGKQIEGVLLDSTTQTQEITMGNYKLTVKHEFTLGWSAGAKNPGWPESGGIVIQTGDDEFLLAGTGLVVTFSHAKDPLKQVGILQANEGVFVNNEWKPGRRMNGDQDHQGRHIRIPVREFGIQKVKLYTYL